MEKPEEYFVRMKKLEEIKKNGVNPYPYSFETSARIESIKDKYEDFENKDVAVAGRVKAVRDFGKALFVDLLGEKNWIQIYIKKDVVGEDKFNFFKKYIDIGDIIGVKGKVMKSKKGEITIFVQEFSLLTKSLLPLPEKYHGLRDKEKRYRQRYLDFIMNEKSKEILIKRRDILDAIREFLNREGFIEIETPVLQPIYGGATARPFTTYANALDTKLFLRISNELYLKRLIVGGFEKVYEFSKDFRNEGIDKVHYPEFTLLEGYIAYKDYFFLMELMERLFEFMLDKVFNKKEIEFNGKRISFKRPYKKIYFTDALKEALDTRISKDNEKEIREKGIAKGIHEIKDLPYHKMIDKLFDELIAKDLWDPTFVLDHPVEISPLAKLHREKQGLTERFEIFIAGMEVVNAFSELNDPIDQRKRFEEQVKYKKAGDEEAHVIDEDFLTALEIGMPPTAGFGIGVDRLCMLLCDAENIRDVISFPQLRPKTE
jgi:lysyl-tRNA synthetase class 2